MSFRYKIEKVSKNGAVDTRSDTFEKDEIVIGRGSGSDILLESSFVSLVHAKLVRSGDNLAIEDLGSLSGVKVNDRLVARQQLAAGDTIKLGDVSLTVTRDGGVWGVLERRAEVEKLDVEAQVKEDLSRISLSSRLPSYRVLSLVCAAAVAAVFFAFPMSQGKKDSWSSGPLSNKHAVFGGNCESCHTAPFTPVKNDACLTCHQMTDHSARLKAVDAREGSCTTCHIEHEGDHGLTTSKDESCTTCHAGIKAVEAKAESSNVTSFAKHPEFDKLVDESNVKLNHEIHLKGPIRSNDGLKSLQCASCHQLGADGRQIEPIDFKKHCQSCHSLGFDERMAQKQVPHGNSSDEIYTFLYAEYSKSLAGKGDVESETRSAEQMLFTKTACQLCHQVKERTSMEPGSSVPADKSLFEILPPQIPTHWMKKARFSHGAHDAVQCESCHKSVRASKATADVLLPNLAQCRSCHAEGGSQGHFVKSDCTMCHSYHDKSPLEPALQQKIEELLVSSH